ncbi:MAG: hypothetical protein ACI9EM_000437 [Candidatus Thalassarchaeaceae archaeon]|jgi:hypothetical protein|tara:strand:+ start:807 stop:1979 length:1173 start_codon:yes stop_codon:yes gene_type:complete
MFPRLYVLGGEAIMWERFKNWKNNTSDGLVCPLCQHKNSAKAEICKSCSYQLNKPNHLQISSIEESETNDLFDELMNESDVEKEEEIIDWSKATFKMDDVTVDVNQYTEEDEVFLSSKPNLSMTSGAIEIPKDKNIQQEDYQLSPEDAPSIPVKFEIPEEDTTEVEEIEYKPVGLIQPTAGTPDNVQITSAEQITEEISEIKIFDAADFDGDGDVDVYEQAFFSEENTLESDISTSIIPPAPLNLPRFEHSEEIFDEMKEEIPAVKDNLPFLPSAPIIPVLEAQEPLFIEIEHKTTYWPWDQQDEWPFSELKEQVLTAMRAAIEKNIAQATVIIDEVGPHLGGQTNLMYPIGKLLDTIGRKNTVDKMIVSAFKYAPNDPNVIQAKQKLRP